MVVVGAVVVLLTMMTISCIAGKLHKLKLKSALCLNRLFWREEGRRCCWVCRCVVGARFGGGSGGGGEDVEDKKHNNANNNRSNHNNHNNTSNIITNMLPPHSLQTKP